MINHLPYLALKTCLHGEGSKNPKNVLTEYMNGPLPNIVECQIFRGIADPSRNVRFFVEWQIPNHHANSRLQHFGSAVFALENVFQHLFKSQI